jgi:hypothetical protein
VHALPDIEVFYRNALAVAWVDEKGDLHNDSLGWYWWFCGPGCLPDCSLVGPFTTKAETLADARNWSRFYGPW